MSNREWFPFAVDYVRNGPKLCASNDTKLLFYAYFKQATVGPCAEHGGSQPWVFQTEARLKWDAWQKLGSMSTEDAETAYVELLTEKLPTWHQKYADK